MNSTCKPIVAFAQLIKNILQSFEKRLSLSLFLSLFLSLVLNTSGKPSAQLGTIR